MVLNCRDWVTYSPIPIFGQRVGIFRILVAFSFLLTMSLVLFWSNIQIRNARSGLIEPILFPSYVRILYGVGFVDLFTFVLVLIVEAHVNNYDARLLYCLAIALQHTVTEGIAFIFMQKGCGVYARKNSQRFAICWFIISFLSSYLVFMDYAIARYIGWTIWLLIVIFYGLLWLLPAKTLFRRPAAISYARFWFWYRVLMFLFYCFILLKPPGTQSWGYCGVLVVGLIGHALCHPLIIYRSLVEDSRWWQGILTYVTAPPPSSNHDPHDETHPSVTDMRSPLLGVDFSIHVASALAEALDYMGERKAVNILNFAQIQITSQRRLLGRGSFSKVFRGVYNGQPCAVKLIYTSDLTEEVISRVTTEATILSAASSINIVKILGIAVLPPSVCMVLELCAYGSLSDVLRGSENGRIPILLKPIDKMYLALGCVRGVAALHALSDKIVHRDIKSFNFLVDSQFNAKLADLELGINTMLINDEYKDEDAPTVDDFLVNWIAPEVLRGESFSQQSDIYSLALVLYEIVTTFVPYDDVPVIRKTQRQAIKDLVITGYRPEIANIDFIPRYLDLIEKGWSESVSLRPSAQEMVEEIQEMWALFINPACEELTHAPEVAQSISNWFQTTEGKEFIKNITASFRIDERRSFRESLSTFQVQVSRNQSLLSQHSRQELLTAAAASAVESNHEFTTIQTIINANVDWIKIESVNEPICIITSCYPYLMLKPSNTLCNLLNIPSNEFFRQSLRHLACPIAATSSLTDYSEIIQQNKCILDEFYMKLESQTVDYHCVLHLFISGTPIPCIIYAYPVYYHEVVYREYYPGLVSILPESVGTTFSSEFYEFHQPYNTSSSTATALTTHLRPTNTTNTNSNSNNLQKLLSKYEEGKNSNSSPSSSFQPLRGVLYYQLHFSKIEHHPTETSNSNGTSNANSTLIGNFTRIFSTSSVKSSSIFNRTDTTNTSNTLHSSQGFVSTSSLRDTSSTLRISNTSQRTVSIGSHPEPNPSSSSSPSPVVVAVENSNQEMNTPENDTLQQQQHQHQQQQQGNEELKSEKSFGEYDSLEGGLMLERTNTLSSLKSINSDGGWVNKL